MTKATPKSCSCAQCRASKNKRSEEHKAERKHRHAAKIALQRNPLEADIAPACNSERAA